MTATALRDLSGGLVAILAPPRRVRVSQAAAEHLYVSESQRWDAALTPYLIRPMDETASRRNRIVCFVGPARTGKTLALIEGLWIYTVTCHPQDFAVVHSSQDLARDFSNRNVRRLHRNAPSLRAALTGRARDDNTYDKVYKSGIMANIAWPSDAQLASRTIPVMLLTDLDRWPREVGGRSTFVQAQKRTETAGSLAMTVVESSPGSSVSPEHGTEPLRFVLGQPLPHAFPPTVSGARANICEIYNGGTREWWYVPCQSCGEYYPQNPSIERFAWGSNDDPLIAAQQAGTVCPWCGTVHPESTKVTENANGVWLAEGETIDCFGKVSGLSRLGHTYPSFALGGGAAAYQTRASIVKKYLHALQSARATGDESTLKGVVNDDIGAPHTSIFLLAGRSASPLRQRAEPLKKLRVPDGARFLVAAVDVQDARFVVQVVGFGPQRNRWLVDRYNIRNSARGEHVLVDPVSFDEDWDLLVGLIEKSYALGDDSGRRMRVGAVLCDSGGRAGVTDKAHAFFRRLAPALKPRFRLVKGEPKDTAPLLEQRYPDTRARRDRRGASHGDVPVLFINTNRMKDRLHGDLSRAETGVGYCHFPDWLGAWFYEELTREQRGSDGRWSSARKNEAWDLLNYCEAGAVLGFPFEARTGARSRGIDAPGFWDTPPPWAMPWDENALVFDPDQTGQPPAKKGWASLLQLNPTYAEGLP